MKQLQRVRWQLYIARSALSPQGDRIGWPRGTTLLYLSPRKIKSLEIRERPKEFAHELPLLIDRSLYSVCFQKITVYDEQIQFLCFSLSEAAFVTTSYQGDALVSGESCSPASMLSVSQTD